MKTNPRFIFLFIFGLATILFSLNIIFFILGKSFFSGFNWIAFLISFVFFFMFSVMYPYIISKIFDSRKGNIFSLKWRQEDKNISIVNLKRLASFACSIVTVLSAFATSYFLFGFFSENDISWWTFAELLTILIFTLISAPMLFMIIADIRRSEKSKLSPEELELEEVREQNERMEE